MTLIVVPPLGDPTAHVVVDAGERLVDLNQRFARRAGNPQTLRALAARLDRPGPSAGGPLPDAQRCLLALAAADALSGPVPTITRLRALGAAIRALSDDDAGLTAALDDITLRSGSTQSSGQTMLAAARSTLFDPELSDPELARPGAGPVEIVVDTDQQLPAAFRLVSRQDRPADLVLSGRFVAAHRKALCRVAALSGVRWSTRVRPRTVRTEYLPAGSAPTHWVTRAGEIPGTGPWAGWLEASAVQTVSARPDHWDRCTGLVVSAAGPDDLAGCTPALLQLAGRAPVALEVLVGGPAVLPVGPEDAWWGPWQPHLRLAGFRPYRRPVGPGRGAPGDDLARWAGPARPPGDGGGAAAALALAWAAAGHDLFPGRVAGALFTTLPPAQRSSRQAGPEAGYEVDSAVRCVRLDAASPDGRGSGDFLVDLRTGRLSRVGRPLAELVRRLGREGLDPTILAALDRSSDDRVLTGLCRAGVLRREQAA
ncbi:MAG TPA: hypothetical protein VI248_14145 [Kineosporiaceae bacterium]